MEGEDLGVFVLAHRCPAPQKPRGHFSQEIDALRSRKDDESWAVDLDFRDQLAHDCLDRRLPTQPPRVW